MCIIVDPHLKVEGVGVHLKVVCARLDKESLLHRALRQAQLSSHVSSAVKRNVESHILFSNRYLILECRVRLLQLIVKLHLLQLKVVKKSIVIQFLICKFSDCSKQPLCPLGIFANQKQIGCQL